MFSQEKHFAHQYLMEEELCKKLGSPTVAQDISYLNNTLMVEEVPVFKGATNKRQEALFIACFSLEGGA